MTLAFVIITWGGDEDLEDFNRKTVVAVNSADSSSGCLGNTDCEIPSQYKSPSL